MKQVRYSPSATDLADLAPRNGTSHFESCALDFVCFHIYLILYIGDSCVMVLVAECVSPVKRRLLSRTGTIDRMVAVSLRLAAWIICIV